MQSNKTSIDGQFITSLVNHPTFITEINRLFRKQTPSSLSSSLYPSPNLPDMADEICNLLSQSYRQTVDQEALTVYQTCSQLTKDIDDLRLRLATCEANRTQTSSSEKERQPDIDLFSSVSAVHEEHHQCRQANQFNPEDRMQPQQSSFIGSLLLPENYRQEFQDKLQASNLHISQRLTGMEQRLAGVDLDFGKKMENIFKTLSNVFENINQLQLRQPKQMPPQRIDQLIDSRLNDSRQVDSRLIDSRQVDSRLIDSRQVDSRLDSRIMDSRLVDSRLPDSRLASKVPPHEKQMKEGVPPRRRSFMGFNY